MKIFFQPQKFVLCKSVLWKTVLAEGWLYHFFIIYMLEKVINILKIFSLGLFGHGVSAPLPIAQGTVFDLIGTAAAKDI